MFQDPLGNQGFFLLAGYVHGLLDVPAGLAQLLAQGVAIVTATIAICDQSMNATQRSTLVLVIEDLRASLQVS
jgi:hypothetical protein